MAKTNKEMIIKLCNDINKKNGEGTIYTIGSKNANLKIKRWSTGIEDLDAIIGGGDWALDRIIPDCIKALEQDKVIDIRSPKAIRPWEHVLEPLSGYMLLAKKQWEHPTEFCEGWNFGPESESVSTVWEVATELIKNYGKGELKDSSDPNAVHEAKLLMLDITKAKTKLGWKPRMNMQQCMELVADWYKRYQTEDVYQLCVEEIDKFINY